MENRNDLDLGRMKSNVANILESMNVDSEIRNNPRYYTIIEQISIKLLDEGIKFNDFEGIKKALSNDDKSFGENDDKLIYVNGTIKIKDAKVYSLLNKGYLTGTVQYCVDVFGLTRLFKTENEKLCVGSLYSSQGIEILHTEKEDDVQKIYCTRDANIHDPTSNRRPDVIKISYKKVGPAQYHSIETKIQRKNMIALEDMFPNEDEMYPCGNAESLKVSEIVDFETGEVLDNSLYGSYDEEKNAQFDAQNIIDEYHKTNKKANRMDIYEKAMAKLLGMEKRFGD